MLKPLLTKVTRITEFIAARALQFIIFLFAFFRYAPNIAWLVPFSFISD